MDFAQTQTNAQDFKFPVQTLPIFHQNQNHQFLSKTHKVKPVQGFKTTPTTPKFKSQAPTIIHSNPKIQQRNPQKRGQTKLQKK